MKEQKQKEMLASMSKSLRKRKYFSILLALFTLGVNIFAWFAFSANAGLSLEGTVASWDVDFKEGDVVFRNFYIEVSKMKPGMTTHHTDIEIENRGDVTADFTYEVNSFTLLGNTVNLANKADVFDYLENFYPFSISFTAGGTSVPANGTLDFDVDVSWPYETTPIPYFQMDENYSFNDTFIYYTKSGDDYSPYAVANASAYAFARNSLYLEKDDADTYFGMQCAAYEQTSGQPCLTLNMRLLVTQANH